jgi:AraC-like DNA-binding protein
MLLPTNKLKALQYLHFTVPVLISIGILPDLFLSEEAKTAVLDNYYVNNKYFISIPVGWIPAGFMQPISIVFGIVYGGLTLVLIQMTRRKQGETYAHINKQTLTWLNLLASAVTIYFMLQLYQYINLFLNNSFDPPSQIIKCLLGILLFSYFISTPNVQENMDGCIVPKGKSLPSLEDLMPELLKEVIADNHAIEFDAQMKDLKAYLSSDYDLSSMAKSIDMPAAKLSKLIKKYYGISFVELINRLRIHYFLQQRASFNQYTLETYMYQSGFTNRSTFYAAFKKYVGVNPSYYLKEMNEAS